jgi:hypothetical protein
MLNAAVVIASFYYPYPPAAHMLPWAAFALTFATASRNGTEVQSPKQRIELSICKKLILKFVIEQAMRAENITLWFWVQVGVLCPH